MTITEIAAVVDGFTADLGIAPTAVIIFPGGYFGPEASVMVEAANNDAEKVSDELMWATGKNGICSSHITINGVRIKVQLRQPEPEEVAA